MVELARVGDHRAFEELVRVTSSDIYALAFRLTGNEHDATDIVQETYLRAFRSIRKFRGDASFSTWLYRIAANASATMHRRRRGIHLLSLEPHADKLVTDPDPDCLAATTVERDRLVRALRSLPMAQRAVVVLRDIYDLSHDDIAAELGISGAAARVRLHRARRQLRNVLFPECPDEPAIAGEGGPILSVVLPVRSSPDLMRESTSRAV